MTNRLPLVSASGLWQQLQPGDLIAPATVVNLTNSDVTTQYAGMVVRSSAPGACVLAQADTVANATAIIGARLTDVLAGNSGAVAVFQPGLRVRLSGSVFAGDQIYLSSSSPGLGSNLPTDVPVRLGLCIAVVNVGGTYYADLLPYQPTPDNGAAPSIVVAQGRVDWDWFGTGTKGSLSLGSMQLGLTSDSEVVAARLMVCGPSWPWSSAGGVNDITLSLGAGPGATESRLCKLTIKQTPTPSPIGYQSWQGDGNPWEQNASTLILTIYCGGENVGSINNGQALVTIWASRSKISQDVVS